MKLLTHPDEVNELDHYIFVVGTRIGECPSSALTSALNSSLDKETKNQIHNIDITSSGLRDVLREVLQGVLGICLHGEKHQITYDLLCTLCKPNTLAYTKCFGIG